MTSLTYEANFATLGNGSLGLWGADKLCNTRAANGKVPAGHYIALLSTATTDAIDRLPDNTRGYVLADGVTAVASSKADLFDGSISHGIDLDENAAPVSFAGNARYVWTGTSANGLRNGTACGNWTSTGAGSVSAGQVDAVNGGWLAAVGAPCNLPTEAGPRLYCVQR